MKSIKKTMEDVNDKLSSETLVKDVIVSKDGLIVMGSVCSMGVLAGFGLEPVWAFKVPAFIGVALVVFHHTFGEFDSKNSKPVVKKTFVEDEVIEQDEIKIFANQPYRKTGENKWERV